MCVNNLCICFVHMRLMGRFYLRNVEIVNTVVECQLVHWMFLPWNEQVTSIQSNSVIYLLYILPS